MLGQSFRNFAVDLLDDPHGINEKAWNSLSDMLHDNGHRDIVQATKATDGRFYLYEDDAEDLRQIIDDGNTEDLSE